MCAHCHSQVSFQLPQFEASNGTAGVVKPRTCHPHAHWNQTQKTVACAMVDAADGHCHVAYTLDLGGFRCRAELISTPPDIEPWRCPGHVGVKLQRTGPRGTCAANLRVYDLHSGAATLRRIEFAGHDLDAGWSKVFHIPLDNFLGTRRDNAAVSVCTVSIMDVARADDAGVASVSSDSFDHVGGVRVQPHWDDGVQLCPFLCGSLIADHEQACCKTGCDSPGAAILTVFLSSGAQAGLYDATESRFYEFSGGAHEYLRSMPSTTDGLSVEVWSPHQTEMPALPRQVPGPATASLKFTVPREWRGKCVEATGALRQV